MTQALFVPKLRKIAKCIMKALASRLNDIFVNKPWSLRSAVKNQKYTIIILRRYRQITSTRMKREQKATEDNSDILSCTFHEPTPPIIISLFSFLKEEAKRVMILAFLLSICALATAYR